MQDPKGYECTKKDVGFAAIMEKILPSLIRKMNWAKSSSENFVNVLDYGCGTGSTGFEHILPHVINCDGILYSVDISAEMIKHAKENYLHEKINYAVGDILGEFPFNEVSFDNIIAINVFHFIPDLNPALEKFLKILKPGGQLCFTALPFSALGYRIVASLANTDSWKQLFSNHLRDMPLWTKCKNEELNEHVKQYFIQAGFSWVELKLFHILVDIPIEALTEFLFSVIPCIAKVPLELHSKLKEDIHLHATQLLAIPLDSRVLTYDGDYILGIVQKLQL